MGAGRLPNISLAGEDEPTWITIHDDLLLAKAVDPIASVVAHTIPCIADRFSDVYFLKERCIMCPKNDEVDSINLHVLQCMPGELHELLSADDICATTNNSDDMQITYPPPLNF
jgi:ATP-dependent DNA helicase PIF1